MSDPPWTIGRLLNWTADFLREKGAESPRLDAEVLLAHAQGCERIELYTRFEEIADEPLRERFRTLVRQRADGVPVAYLAGRREFFSLPFEVTRDVLIPRPETEQLVVRALDVVRQRISDGPIDVVDIGTGSGILAVCLAKQLPDCRVVALDVSGAALEVAAGNAARHNVDERIEFVESDLFAAIDAEREFDLIVTNPPYVKTAELGEVAVGVRKYEPRIALDGGEQGIDVYQRLIPEVPGRLRPGGWFFAEIGPAVADDVERLIARTAGLKPHPTLRDLSDHPRVVQACREESS